MQKEPQHAPALYNPLEPRCAACAEVNRVIRHDAPEAEAVMPEHLGTGFYRKSLVRPAVRLSVTDISFHRGMVLHGGLMPPQSRFNLLFCLGHDLEWHSGLQDRNCTLREGEAILHQGAFRGGRWTVPRDFRLVSIELGLGEEALRELLPDAGHHKALARILAGEDGGGALSLSPALRRILEEIYTCRLTGLFRRLFLEAKSLELLARYLHERTGENPEKPVRTPLSRTDVQRIRQARALLDADIANAPPLRTLARMAGLNECKLKAGFKSLFGMPVHAYVIDRRLDTARLLLERDGLDVTTTANSVGYTELGYFSRRFKEKFGLSPSTYRKRFPAAPAD